MRPAHRLCIAFFCLQLAACGGSGGNVNTSPPPPAAPTPTPPPAPMPTTLSLQPASDQVFDVSSTSTKVSFSTADGVAKTTEGKREPLELRYDATSGNYKITIGSRSQQFSASNRLPERVPGEAIFEVSISESSNEYLTLSTIFYALNSPAKYVGMGYWQQNALATADVQTTIFSTFAYGYQSPRSAVPRTGFASWDTDIFGLLSRPTERTRTMQGSGRLDIDFDTGSFITSGRLAELDVVGSGGSSSYDLEGGGSITSDGAISGVLSYSGAAGYLVGNFFGPHSEELGATFLATSSYGEVLNGVMTGTRNSEIQPEKNMTLLHLQVDELLTGPISSQEIRVGQVATDAPASPTWVATHGGVRVSRDGPTGISLTVGAIIGLQRDEEQPRDNFVRYTGNSEGVPISVDFYKSGESNTELPLTYTSFATWGRTEYTGSGSTKFVDDSRYYLVYGIKPTPNLLALSGKANYQGVIHGLAATREGARYSLGGSSQFSVDFDKGTYSGSLEISGSDASGAAVNFGTYPFSSTLTTAGFNYAVLRQHPTWSQAIHPQFFGPHGEEIGANFNILQGEYGDPDTIYIDGITIAKRK